MKLRKLRRAIVKEEFFALTGDSRTASILNQFLYWTDKVNDFDEYVKEEKARGVDIGGIELKHGWIFKKAEDIAEENMLKASKATIGRLLKPLLDIGVLHRRCNPDKNWDSTYQYRVDIPVLQKRLHEIGHTLSGYSWVPEYCPDEEECQNENMEFQNSALGFQTETLEYQTETAIPETTNKDYKQRLQTEPKDKKKEKKGFFLSFTEAGVKTGVKVDDKDSIQPFMNTVFFPLVQELKLPYTCGVTDVWHTLRFLLAEQWNRREENGQLNDSDQLEFYTRFFRRRYQSPTYWAEDIIYGQALFWGIWLKFRRQYDKEPARKAQAMLDTFEAVGEDYGFYLQWLEKNEFPDIKQTPPDINQIIYAPRYQRFISETKACQRG